VADCAHAIETQYHGRPVASLADMSVHSFYVTKNMTTVEGGMLLTDNSEWAERISLLRNHGLSRDAWKRYSVHGFQPYEVVEAGYKYNMTDIQAALGLHQMSRIEGSLEVRERHWDAYREGLADVDGLTIPDEDPEPLNRHARHLFIVLLDIEKLAMSRDDFVVAMQAENIGTGIHFTALHLHHYYRETFGFKEGDYPRAEWVGERTLSLPLSAKLTDEDVQDTIRAVRKVATAFSAKR
jgi:dTDP-4-amino-4,6-dideoxygalactose transaminase